MISAGRHYLAIPGPSVVPDRVLNAMHRASPDIYGAAFQDIVPAIVDDLKAVARTRDHVAIYIGNGHAAWEAANCNLFSRGDRALSLVTGRFGEGWAQYAEGLGVVAERLDFGRHGPVDPERVEAALRADLRARPRSGAGTDGATTDGAGLIRVVLLSHVDTTTSVRNDVQAVRAAIDAAGHPALLAVDGIASFGCDVFEMDAWGVDVMVAASQKGLMTPPGLGFVFVSDKALRGCTRSERRTPYWDWTPRIRPEFFSQRFSGTAPTHLLYGLQTALGMILREEGLDAVWARHARLARAVWAACEAWGAGAGQPSDIGLNIASAAHRSHAVSTVRFKSPFATEVRRWVEAHAGVTLGVGLGMGADANAMSDGHLRIAHMGHVNAQMTLGLLGAIETAMVALGIAHGAGGVSRAADVLAQVG